MERRNRIGPPLFPPGESREKSPVSRLRRPIASLLAPDGPGRQSAAFASRGRGCGDRARRAGVGQAGHAALHQHPPLPDNVTLAALDNGLTVIVQENHAAPVATVRCYVKNTGSAFEGRYLGAG